VRWQLYRRALLYIALKGHELWSTNGLKLDRHFYSPSVISAFHFIARLHTRRSANRTQPHFAKRRTVNRANNQSQGVPPYKTGVQKLLHLLGFSTTSRLNGEYLQNETRHCKVQRVLYTSIQNLLNFGSQTA